MTEYAQCVEVYNDGESSKFCKGSDRFNEICTAYNLMIDGAHQMPAYGVSLHRETVKAVKKGVWVEFSFEGVMSSDGMPYEKLLINAQPEWSGFNIVRYTAKRGYDGRCFYYDLVDKNMASFYGCLTK